jgi:acyl dehydratase
VTSAPSTRRPALEVGSRLPPLTVRFTRADLVRYAGASTDFNPIHYSDRHARQVGLPGVVAHGMLTMGAGLRVITDWLPTPAAVVSYFARFTKPVGVPDDDAGAEVHFAATVAAVEGSLITFTVEAVCADQKVLGAARAVVDLDA